MHSLFSTRLKKLRKEKKVPQQEIADALGVSTRAYRFYESGSRYPNFHGLIILAELFDVSIDYLVGRTNER